MILNILKTIYVSIVIISLVAFFGGLIYEIKNNSEFVDKMTCNKTLYNGKPQLGWVNGTLTNVTEENNRQCERMETLVNTSNNLIFIVILFWIWVIRKDLKELWEWFDNRIEWEK